MPIPDYQTLMLPLLKIASDNQDHNHKDVMDILAKEFQLTEEDQKELIPSGTKTKFYDRVTWANSYLRNSGLLMPIKRGVFKITQKGHEVLQTNPQIINKEYLMSFPEFVNFITKNNVKIDINPEYSADQTPEELIASSFIEYQNQLKVNLLEAVKELNDYRFESLVLDLIISMGYGNKKYSLVTKKTADAGVDGKILMDPLGFEEQIYIQAKKYSLVPIGRPEIQAFYGALGDRVSKGVFITTSDFAKPAIEYANSIQTKNIVLIGGNELVEKMIEYGVGVTILNSYEIKKIDLSRYEVNSEF